MAKLKDLPSEPRAPKDEGGFIGLIRSLQRNAERLCGAALCWKDADRAYRASMPTSLVAHENPFCMAVKDDLRNRPRCVADCLVEKGAAFWHRRRSGATKTCHAGVAELVTPVWVGDEFLGVCHIGPFRTGTRPSRTAPVSLWKALPELDAHAGAGVVELVRRTLALSAPQRDCAISLDRHSGALHPAVHATLSSLEREGRVNARVSVLARSAHISESRLVHLLKEATGKTFTDLRTDAAMRRARRMLADPSNRVADVSAAVGYANQNRFAAAFRRCHGCTATEFRRRLFGQVQV